MRCGYAGLFRPLFKCSFPDYAERIAASALLITEPIKTINMKLTLYHLATSRSQRILWLLEEFQLAHELIVCRQNPPNAGMQQLLQRLAISILLNLSKVNLI